MSHKQSIPNARLFVALVKQAQIIMESGVSWDTIYDLIFSDDISFAIRETGISVEYCDPDTTEEEDVRAYVTAHVSRAVEISKVIDALDHSQSQSSPVLIDRRYTEGW